MESTSRFPTKHRAPPSFKGGGDLLQVPRPEQSQPPIGQAHIDGYVLLSPVTSHHLTHKASALLDPVVFHDLTSVPGRACSGVMFLALPILVCPIRSYYVLERHVDELFAQGPRAGIIPCSTPWCLTNQSINAACVERSKRLTMWQMYRRSPIISLRTHSRPSDAR